MYELCAPVFCCSAGHTVGDHVGKTWFRISLHNKSSKKSAFQSTMEHLTYLDIMDTFALTVKYHKGLSILIFPFLVCLTGLSLSSLDTMTMPQKYLKLEPFFKNSEENFFSPSSF